MEAYLPRTRRSLKFLSKLCQQDKEVTSQESSLCLFESILHNETATFFAGGPIWASAFCPLEGRNEDHVIALYAEQTFDSESYICPTKESVSDRINSLIQLWSFRKTKTGCDPPVFLMGIAHDFGRVRSLQWCPSGGQSDTGNGLPRIGLLAAGCEDGTVRIFTVPEYDSIPKTDPTVRHNIFKCDDAVVTLRRPDDDEDRLNPTVKVAWFRGRGHRVIAASFADGHVGLWDLDTTSSLLRDEETRTIYPYRFFRAHCRNNQTFLDLSTESDESGFPLYLATGSTDRMFTSWDLGSSVSVGEIPVRECRRMFITDVAWLNHFPGNATVSHDDSCLQTNTR